MSAERRRLIEAMRGGGALVLATLVHADGSSYRRPGARLLLSEQGGVVAGTISGGCLEGDLVRRAFWLTRQGPVLQHYSTAFDDTAEIPYGLGCGGELDVLLERSGTPEFDALAEALAASQAGSFRRVLTQAPASGSRDLARRVTDASGTAVYVSTGFAEAGSVSETTKLSFQEELAPSQRLVLFGAGDDARPLAALGRLLGWRVVVADGRRGMARASRFPEADEVHLLEHPGQIALAPDDAVVVMTHSYEQDRALLVEALAAAPRYLGLLGARHRSCLLVAEAAQASGWSIEACCARLHAPVGLDLGGDGPEAIALAVVAEIQACVQERPGGSRRLAVDEVRERAALHVTEGFVAARCALDDAGQGGNGQVAAG